MKNCLFGMTLLGAAVCSLAGEKTLVDYFLPAEPQGSLVSKGIWGAPNVLPRDIKNGLEDPKMEKWCYWDGMVVKADDGKYYMYASRWTQESHHHNGWTEDSKGIVAISDHMMGPYRDMGEAWPDWICRAGYKGAGHNVVGLRMKDGRYAMVTSEITDGNIFVSDRPAGPFKHLGVIQVDYNGFEPGLARYNTGLRKMANVMIFLRPDGRYALMGRNCSVMISDGEITGPYKIMSGPAWKDLEGVEQDNMEDPTIWYSDGMYHIVVNYHVNDTSYHLTSLDGIHNWKNRGLAMSRQGESIFRYTDGTVNKWFIVQRPTVYLEDGEVKAFNFSVIDVHKGDDGGNDNHGSKIVMVPFDGKAFAKDMRALIKKEYEQTMATPLPDGWQLAGTGRAGYEASVGTVWVKTSEGKNAESFIQRKASGDVMLSALVMSQDIAPDMAAAGLAFRQTPDGTNAAAMTISPTKGKYRAPYFIRMVKQGDTVTTYVSQTDQYNWEELESVKVDLEGDFYAGALATSENGKPGLARFKNLEVHALGTHDRILWHDLDYSLFRVAYETTQPRDITLGLQKTGDWSSFPGMKKTVNGYGVAEFDYDTGGLDPEVEKGYRWVLSLLPENGDWKQGIESTKREVEALTE